MFRRFSINFALFSIILDAAIVSLALAASNSLRPLLNTLPFAADIYRSTIPLILYPVFSTIWVLIFLLLSVYDGRKNLFVTDEFTSLAIASVLASISTAGLLYLTFRDVSRLIFLVFVIFSFSAMLIWRIIVRIGFRISAEHSNQNRGLLIIGAGPVGRELLDLVNEHQYLNLKFVGFLDDDKDKRLAQNDVIGSLEEAREIILDHHIDDVVIALPIRAHDKVQWLSTILYDLPVKIWVIPDYFQLALHKAAIEEFAGIPMLDLRAPALTDYQRLVKRGFDLAVVLLLLPMSLLIMLFAAIAVRLEGPGPVFFRQKRVGENGRLFEMIKFRTMVPDAEDQRSMVETFDEDGHLIHKSSSDPRVTRVGKFLRKASVDELPQLINILKGEMSLVGPRPELPYLVEQYEPWQRKRFAVPQGITGWWQVNGRSDKPMHLNTEDDLYYVQNYSLLLDLRILLKTIMVVFRGKGAY